MDFPFSNGCRLDKYYNHNKLNIRVNIIETKLKNVILMVLNAGFINDNMTKTEMKRTNSC